MDAEKLAVVLRNTIRDIPKRFDYNVNEISKLEKEVIDLEHVIELTNFNAAEGFKLAKQIQEARQKRRKLKDENEMILSLNRTLSNMKDHVPQLDQVIGDIRKVKSNQENRSYKCRVRKDLQEKF